MGGAEVERCYGVGGEYKNSAFEALFLRPMTSDITSQLRSDAPKPWDVRWKLIAYVSKLP